MTPRPLLTLVLLLVVAAGCGVPTDDSPRAIETPPMRLDGTGNPAAAGAGSAVVRLYLVREGRLVRVLRRVPEPLTARQQLDALLAGPTGDEATDGFTSALSTMSITGMTIVERRATITVADHPDQLARTDEILAYGQIVCTLTSQSDVGTVSFESGGELLGVPRADGSLSDGPLTIADYSGLVAQ